jgi:Xaa-Pro aminopeptidase
MAEEDRLRRARKSVGMGMTDCVVQPDMVRMRGYRMARFQAELKRRDYGGAILYDPVNIRYATGSRNMAVWTLHNPARYAFVPAEGKAVIFDFHNCEHLSEGLETVSEVRPARAWYFFASGNRTAEKAKLWANEIIDLIKERCGGNRRIAVDRLDHLGFHHLEAAGIEVMDAQEPCEMARVIKSADELACMSQAIAVCEAGMARMHEALKPGLTENELFAMLSDTNMQMGGEWMECRLLSSGGRTNPWFQEAGDRIVRPGDLVAFDTDLIGPHGYCCDISRTYFCGPGKPSAEQRKLYGLAMEQIHHNIDQLRAGMTLGEFSERAWRIPAAYAANRYSGVAHGVGMCDEWPHVAHVQDLAASGYDGVLEENMTICIESYIGEEGGVEGVKLEQQVLVTRTGCQVLTTFPFEDALYG